MPKVNKLVKADPREIETRRKLGAAQAATGLSCAELCRRAGLRYDCFIKHRKRVGEMRLRELWAFMDVCEANEL